MKLCIDDFYIGAASNYKLRIKLYKSCCSLLQYFSRVMLINSVTQPANPFIRKYVCVYLWFISLLKYFVGLQEMLVYRLGVQQSRAYMRITKTLSFLTITFFQLRLKKENSCKANTENKNIHAANHFINT